MADDIIESASTKTKKTNTLKTLAKVLAVGLFLFLILIEVTSSSFQLRYVFFVGIPILLLVVFAFFGFGWINKLLGKAKEEVKESKLATEEQIIEKVKTAVHKRFNHIKQSIDNKSYNRGTIYSYRVKLLYPETFIVDGIEKKSKIATILVDSSNISKPAIFLYGIASEAEITVQANHFSSAPDESPETIRTSGIDPLTGRYYEQERKIPPKKKEKEEGKKEELVEPKKE